MTVTREYLPGLRLAQQFIAESVSEEAASDLNVLIAQASAAPKQEAARFERLDREGDWEVISHAEYEKSKDSAGIYQCRALYTHADSSEVERLRAQLKTADLKLAQADHNYDCDRMQFRQQLADAHSAAGGLQDLCRFLAASYCELDELRYTTAKLPADQIRDFLIGKWPVIQGTANQMNIKRIADQPYDQVGALQGIIAMFADAQPAEPYTDPRNGADTWSANGEDWHNIGTVAELIRESQSDLEPLAEGDVVFVGTIRYQDPASFVDHDAVLTSMNENAGASDAGEWVDGYPNSSQAADLELTHLLEAWARKNCRPDFYLVDNSREYTITADDMAAALAAEVADDE